MYLPDVPVPDMFLSPSSLLFIPSPVYVSKPRISFCISKEGASYIGNVTCWSTRGSPPVNFSLSIDDKEVGSVSATESLAVWFPVAMVPGLDMGVARCRVNTEVQDLMSEPVALEVGMSYTDKFKEICLSVIVYLFITFLSLSSLLFIQSLSEVM